MADRELTSFDEISSVSTKFWERSRHVGWKASAKWRVTGGLVHKPVTDTDTLDRHEKKKMEWVQK